MTKRYTKEIETCFDCPHFKRRGHNYICRPLEIIMDPTSTDQFDYMTQIHPDCFLNDTTEGNKTNDAIKEMWRLTQLHDNEIIEFLLKFYIYTMRKYSSIQGGCTQDGAIRDCCTRWDLLTYVKNFVERAVVIGFDDILPELLELNAPHLLKLNDIRLQMKNEIAAAPKSEHSLASSYDDARIGVLTEISNELDTLLGKNNE